MNIVILGAGRVGFGVAKELSFEENDVSVVDFSKSALDIVSQKLDVKSVLGHASDIKVLQEAGLESADVLIAATSSDEVNITACQIAHFFFKTKTKIARVSRNSYFDVEGLFEKDRFHIDFVVSPSFEVVKLVKRKILIPGAIDVISCANNRLRVIGVLCKQGAPLADIQLKYLSSVDTNSRIAVLYIRRNNGSDPIIPNKSDIIKPGDEVYFVCDSKQVNYAMALFGYSVDDNVNIVFIGGSKLCEEIVSSISYSDISIKIIENDFERAEELSEKLNGSEVLCGDPMNSEVLENADIQNAGLVISVTDDDKVNILSSLLSKKLGARRVATILNDSSYSNILYSLGINSVLDSRMSAISKILNHIRRGGVEDVISFSKSGMEVISVDVLNNSHVVGTLSNDITVKNDVQIPAIVRGGDQTFILPQKMIINAGDNVLFSIKKDSIERILKLFQEKPKYLL